MLTCTHTYIQPLSFYTVVDAGGRHALVYQWLAGYRFASHVALWLRHRQGAVVAARFKNSLGCTLCAYLMCSSLAELCSIYQPVR